MKGLFDYQHGALVEILLQSLFHLSLSRFSFISITWALITAITGRARSGERRGRWMDGWTEREGWREKEKEGGREREREEERE